MVDLWLVVAFVLGTVGAVVVLRRTVFAPERDDPVAVARLRRNLGRRGLRRCPHCDHFLPVAQHDCPGCGIVSEPKL